MVILLSVQNVTKAYGAAPLFAELSLALATLHEIVETMVTDDARLHVEALYARSSELDAKQR